MYDAQANSIRIEDIASNDNNRIMLERIKRNSVADDTELYIQNQHDINGEACQDYVPEGANDMGWLGYFISKSNCLEKLYIRDFTPTSGASVMEVLEPLFMGVNNNKSIHKLSFYGMDLLGGKIFTILGPFFENCPTLADLKINICHLGDDGWRLLSMAIGSSKNKSLENVSLPGNNISNEALVDIVTSLSMHPNLKGLELNGNQISTNGCMTLATLLRNSVTNLETLDLESNEINDEGLDVLVPALKSCYQLRTLWLSRNESITSKGWQYLASILEAPNSNLKDLALTGNNVDDKALTSFADAMKNNRSFEVISLGSIASDSIDGEASRAFSKLICDTSSINSTFLSNHTLTYVTQLSNTAPLQPIFRLNERKDKKEVAMIKILQHHDDFDMTPFFEWEFKVLPLMIEWFERASSITMPDNFQSNIGPRKLSSIYQFVRGMPLLYVETRLRKELEDIKAAQIHIDEEQARLDRQKQLNEERKRGILERLGRNV